MVFTEVGMVTAEREVQESKALVPILVTNVGNKIRITEVHFFNA